MKDGLPIIILAAAIVAAIILVFVVDAWILKRRAKKEEVERKKKEEAEAARIAALPKVDKTWLLQKSGAGMGPNKGWYGNRYHRLLIMDPDGSTWVGLAIPEVLESLRECEYSPHNFWIPFCGPGEARYGNPVEMDGIKIEVYPDCMVPGEDLDNWRRWAAIERKYEEHTKNGWDYQRGLGDLRRAIEARNE